MSNFVAHEYQNRCIDFLIDNPKSALFLEMGLGKTVTVLTAINKLMFDTLDIKRVLIVAPLRVATVTWPLEIEKWEHTRKFSYRVLHGKGRIDNPPDVDITVINYEGLQWLAGRPNIYQRFDHVVFDESTMIKNEASMRWKAAFRMFCLCSRVTILTGTPVPNGLMDIWGQTYLLDHGERLGRTKGVFKSRYFFSCGFNGYTYLPLRGSTKKVINKIKDIALTLKAADYLSMPPLIFNDVTTEMADKEKKKYKKLEREFFVDIGDSTITAFNAASLSTKLRQYVQGFLYKEDGSSHKVHNRKTDAIKELILSHPTENFIIAVNFVAEAEELKEMYKDAGLVCGLTKTPDDVQTIKKWNSGKLKILIAHPASLSHGLNLQDGGRMIIWSGPTWNLEHWKQLNARLHRQGQNKPVMVHTIVMKGTLDARVSSALKGKDATQEKLISGLIK